MQNLSAAQKLKPRLMSVALMIAKTAQRAKISTRFIHQEGIDTSVKIVSVEKGKPAESEELNNIIREIVENKKSWVNFDGEFIRINEEATGEKLTTEEKEFSADLSEKVTPVSEETEGSELNASTKKKKPR